MNGIPDPIEIGNQEIARQKAVSDAMSKQMDLATRLELKKIRKNLKSVKLLHKRKLIS